MICPHCAHAYHEGSKTAQILEDKQGTDYWIVYDVCARCGKGILQLLVVYTGMNTSYMIWPRHATRRQFPVPIPDAFAEDYAEACAVLADSPKASAALSRRCLQHLLRERAGVKKGDLANEIQQVIDSRQLPSHLSENVDAIRNIGNFASHPLKSTNSGEVLPVEPGEAEWNLEVLEDLLDFYLVQPEIAKQKRSALNAKLSEAGKPAMKS